MNFIITISREYGSGGRFIGKLIAEKLGISFYDNELLEKAANISGISQGCVENFDETKDGAFSYAQGLYGMDMSLGQKVFLAQFDVIKRLAKEESCVIVGRCADYALRHNPDLKSIFIYAPIEKRIETIMKRFDLTEDKAKSQINKEDKGRASYYNYYTSKKWGSIDSYDICINSSLMSAEKTVDFIIEYLDAM